MRYTTDLTDNEWGLISYCFPKPSKKGRPRAHPYRERLNAIFHRNKTGCQWRNSPAHLAPGRTVSHYFRLWKKSGLWVAIHTQLREQVRLVVERQRHASAADHRQPALQEPTNRLLADPFVGETNALAKFGRRW